MRSKRVLAGLLPFLVAVVAASPSAAQQWISGTTAYASGLTCGGPLVGNYTENQVGAFTGYYGKTDVSYPKIGDRYFGRVYYTTLGIGCGLGVHGTQVEISLPAGTALAVVPNSTDQNDKVRCWGYPSTGGSEDVTNQTWRHPDNQSLTGRYCEANPFQSANGVTLSYALTSSGQSLEIIFPLRSTRKLSGAADGNASRLTATVTNSNAYNSIQPYQWVFVGDRPVEAECPGAGVTAASAINNTTAHTKNFMCNWYRTGKASIELGEGATGPYQVTSQQYNVPGSTQGYVVDQDWNNLIPGTTYHWRLKFVDDKGTPATFDDTTHYSQPKTFATTGTRPVNPPTTMPGAGTGGAQTDPGPGTGGGGPGSGTPPADTGGQQQPGQQQQPAPEQQQDQVLPEVAPRDTTAPALSTVAPKLKLGDLLKKGLRAATTCSEACRIQAVLQIDAKTAKKLKLGKKATTVGTGAGLSPGGKTTVTVKLTAKAKKALGRVRSLRAKLVVSATDLAGNAAKPVTKSLLLKK